MPVYDYHCGRCDAGFSAWQPMSHYKEPASCPLCTDPAQRRIVAPRLNTMNAARRRAHQINERSAHQPKLSRAHSCGPGCSHNAAGAAPLRRIDTAKRPWMLGH